MENALKTLFHPFEDGILPPPADGQPVLFFGARPGIRLPEGFSTNIVAIQGFRPEFLALQQAGFTVEPLPLGQDYETALVLAGRHREENELRIAEALDRTRPDSLIVVAGSKDDGIASLRKRMNALIPLEGHLPKFHGVVFWLSRPADAEAVIEALRSRIVVEPVAGRFVTAPGMFSHDRLDEGSRLLAERLPGSISGNVADFCAGWGYLAYEVALNCPVARSIDLYEADFASLEAAKINLADVTQVPVRFFWHDLAGENVMARYDSIVMNPPFHTGRRAEPDLGQRMIEAAAKALKPGGRLMMVANRQLPYERNLSERFSEFSEVGGNGRFKVLLARR
jgi:16S rRNA (guanine1207-N2)-methyltransferase